MRELARLLIEIRKIKPEIKNLFQALKPENFGELVTATKIMGNYNAEKDYYESASTALNMGTTIKHCCHIAICFVLKKKQVHATIAAAEAEADLKTLIQLIDSEWRFEISTQASNDLNVKKWNKITMVPLASDLKLVKEYLTEKANAAVKILLNCDINKEAYITLLETVFCRVLLLNRRRPGELQRLPLHVYQLHLEDSQKYEEFADMVTPTEKILLRVFKRIVIRGKRGRGVPVLFSSDVQEHIEVLLKSREKILNKNNPYLFGNVSTLQPICGYKVITKYAKLSGAKNPDAITATKLRKHLATLTQVLNMSENDLEQLSTFMGHTVNIHRGSYRLPDDVFQTAKVSKLLLLMEKGEAALYKGKSLDDIDLDLTVEEENDSDQEENNTVLYDVEELPDTVLRPGTSSLTDSVLATVKGKSEETRTRKRVLVPWTQEQKKAVLQFFANHIKNSIPPKKQECLILKEKYSTLFENKDWLKIKVFVQNEYMKKKKR